MTSGPADYHHVLVERDGPRVTVTMNRPQRRNALSLEHLQELLAVFRAIGESDATGVVLAGNGPVFSSGHDFADMDGADLAAMRRLLSTCTDVMLTMQDIPQVVIARVHALATAAGCQLVATCDLAVAAQSAGFAIPGGKGGLFCHTPLVAVARNVGRKRALELLLLGEMIDAPTALDWGLVNRVVPPASLDAAVDRIAARIASLSATAVADGKRSFYQQVDVPIAAAYGCATPSMVDDVLGADAVEGVAAFLTKRRPVWPSAHPLP